MLTYGERTLATEVQPWGQSVVASPFLGGGAVARWDGRSQQGAFQVLLEQLAGDAGLSGRDQVQVRRIAVLLHPVGGQRPRLGAQTLTDHPALDSRMETVFEENLRGGRRELATGNVRRPCRSLSDRELAWPAVWERPQSCKERLWPWRRRTRRRPPPPRINCKGNVTMSPLIVTTSNKSSFLTWSLHLHSSFQTAEHSAWLSAEPGQTRAVKRLAHCPFRSPWRVPNTAPLQAERKQEATRWRLA